MAALIFNEMELMINNTGPPIKITLLPVNLPHKLIVSFC
jgi:hypothetical protein